MPLWHAPGASRRSHAVGSAPAARARRQPSLAPLPLLLLAGGCVAQMQSADDKAGLLAFKAGGDPAVGDGASWTLDSEPCDEGWYSRGAGWLAVDCSAPGSLGGRVTQLRAVTAGLGGECLFAGTVGALAQVDAIVTIDLQGCDGVRGQVAPLASLAQLTFLALGGTSVTGAVQSLTGLSGLLTLQLAGSSVYGDITPLKALVSSEKLSAVASESRNDAERSPAIAARARRHLGSVRRLQRALLPAHTAARDRRAHRGLG